MTPRNRPKTRDQNNHLTHPKTCKNRRTILVESPNNLFPFVAAIGWHPSSQDREIQMYLDLLWRRSYVTVPLSPCRFWALVARNLRIWLTCHFQGLIWPPLPCEPCFSESTVNAAFSYLKFPFFYLFHRSVDNFTLNISATPQPWRKLLFLQDRHSLLLVEGADSPFQPYQEHFMCHYGAWLSPPFVPKLQTSVQLSLMPLKCCWYHLTFQAARRQ